MSFDVKSLIGLGGVAPHDSPRAKRWQHRLHWFMVIVALLSVPAFIIDESFGSPTLRAFGRSCATGSTCS